MRTRIGLCLVAAALLAPTAQAALLPFPALMDVLTLGADPLPPALFELASTPVSGLDVGERALLDETLEEPLALLELPRVPTELLGILAVDEIGPVKGPRVTELSDNVTLGAMALGEGPIPAERLRSYRLQASVRDEDPEAQRADMAALLAGAHG